MRLSSSLKLPSVMRISSFLRLSLSLICSSLVVPSSYPPELVANYLCQRKYQDKTKTINDNKANSVQLKSDYTGKPTKNDNTWEQGSQKIMWPSGNFCCEYVTYMPGIGNNVLSHHRSLNWELIELAFWGRVTKLTEVQNSLQFTYVILERSLNFCFL